MTRLCHMYHFKTYHSWFVCFLWLHATEEETALGAKICLDQKVENEKEQRRKESISLETTMKLEESSTANQQRKKSAPQQQEENFDILLKGNFILWCNSVPPTETYTLI